MDKVIQNLKFFIQSIFKSKQLKSVKTENNRLQTKIQQQRNLIEDYVHRLEISTKQVEESEHEKQEILVLKSSYNR